MAHSFFFKKNPNNIHICLPTDILGRTDWVDSRPSSPQRNQLVR